MNLPNKITLARIFMIPFALLFFLMPFSELSRWVALLIFVVAAATDGLDGYLARRDNLVTDLGKFLDPLADKLLMLSFFVSFVATGDMMAWVVIIIMARELMVTGFRSIAAGKGRIIAASRWGKIKTVTQIITIVIVLLSDLVPGVVYLQQIAIIATLLVTVYSGWDYIMQNKHILQEK